MSTRVVDVNRPNAHRADESGLLIIAFISNDDPAAVGDRVHGQFSWWVAVLESDASGVENTGTRPCTATRPAPACSRARVHSTRRPSARRIPIGQRRQLGSVGRGTNSRVEPHVRVRRGFERPRPKRVHLLVQALGELADLRLPDALDAELLDDLVDLPRRDPPSRSSRRRPRSARAPSAVVAPAATPGSSCPPAASGSPARWCPPACPSAGSGIRCAGSPDPATALRTPRRRVHPHPRPSTPRRTSAPCPEADPSLPLRGACAGSSPLPSS